MHETVKMERTGRTAHRFRFNGGRMCNVWTNYYTCPTCGVKKKHLSNVMKGRSFICNGETVKLVKN